MSDMEMTDVERALYYTLCMSKGIMPIDDLQHDMNRVLQQLSPTEARKCKRKFRKLWRKEMKRLLATSKSKKARFSTKEMLAVGTYTVQENPASYRSQRRARQTRKALVRTSILKESARILPNR